MSGLPIITSLSLPGVTTFPSANCIQWSDDGQAVLLTAKAILILTPDPGVFIEKYAVIKQSSDKSMALTSSKPIGWLRTMIEWDKTFEVHQWAADCGEWGSVALGSLDLAFIAVSCSPSNLTEIAGCIYAVLNSNAEVFLFKPTKNHLTGKWSMVHNLLGSLKASAETAALDNTFQTTLFMQATCICWSHQADFGISPAASLDGSLLAVGNRAGRVCLFRYRHADEAGDPIEPLASIEVADRWVTHLTWTRWATTQPNQCTAYLACGIADGSIVIIQVTQSLRSDLGQSFAAKQEISLSYETSNEQPGELDQRKISSLKWADVPGRGPILVFTKPGTAHLWSGLLTPVGWDGVRTIFLKTQKLTTGSSSLSPISGIAYTAAQDALVLSLADGSFHVISTVSTNPSLSLDGSSGGLTSSSLSTVARADFFRVEEEPKKNTDVNATHGMAAYDQSSFYLWIHEALRPADFNYKHDAKHNSMFVCAQLWEDDSDDTTMNFLETAIFGAKAAHGEAPLSILRPAFTHFRNADCIARLYLHLMQVLQKAPMTDASISSNLPSWSGGLTPELRRQVRTSLRTELFGWDSFLSQRLQISLAGFCEEHCAEPGLKAQFHQAEANVRAFLWPRILRVLIRHIVAVWSVLTPDDIHFVRRIAVQALLPSIPPDVVEEARALLTHAQAAGMPAPTSDEVCPACHAQVPLNDGTTATCPNGHVWARCSLTSFILSTPLVRTCVGCGRKALRAPHADHPTQNWAPPAARSWLVEELLHAAQRCFFCGNNFVTLI